MLHSLDELSPEARAYVLGQMTELMQILSQLQPHAARLTRVGLVFCGTFESRSGLPMVRLQHAEPRDCIAFIGRREGTWMARRWSSSEDPRQGPFEFHASLEHALVSLIG